MASARADLLSSLVDDFKWEAPSASVVRVGKEFDRRLTHWFDQVRSLPFATRMPHALAECMEIVLTALGDTGCAELLRIPRLRQLAWHEPDRLSPYQLGLLLKITYAYAVSIGVLPLHGSGLWDPFGHRKLSDIDAQKECRPRIDLASDHPVRSTPGIDSGYAADPTKGSHATRNVEHALNLLSQEVPNARSLVDSSIEVYVLRFGGLTDSSGLSSSSCHELNGAVLIVNADKGRDIVDRVAESILHEAIHNHISKIEALTAPFNAGGETVSSPWTGSALVPQNYVHACFVWFGLVQLWRIRFRTDSWKASFIPCVELAERGFKARMLSRSDGLRARLGLDERLFGILVSMEEQVCREPIL